LIRREKMKKSIKKKRRNFTRRDFLKGFSSRALSRAVPFLI
jgi:hypothetical protein